jgi:hypothetical protein
VGGTRLQRKRGSPKSAFMKNICVPLIVVAEENCNVRVTTFLDSITIMAAMLRM